jgi:hypothetical protein
VEAVIEASRQPFDGRHIDMMFAWSDLNLISWAMPDISSEATPSFSRERATILTLASAEVLEPLLDLLLIAVGQLLTAKKRIQFEILTIDVQFAKVLLFEEEFIRIFDPSEPGCSIMHDRF